MASSSRSVVASGPMDMAAAKTKPMARRGFGRLGRRVLVDSNFFRLHAPRLTTICQYDVAIMALRRPESSNGQRRHRSPSAPTKVLTNIAPSSNIEFNRAVFKHWCLKLLGNYLSLAYDGRSNAYTPSELPSHVVTAEGGTGFAIEVDRDGPASANSNPVETVFVKVKHASTIDCRAILGTGGNVLDEMPALAAIDNVLGTGPLQTHVQVGRSFFTSYNPSDLEGGIEAWRGFYQSARPSISGLLVNMDESRTPFWGYGGRPLVELLQAMRCFPGRDVRENKRCAKLVYGLKVKATHNNITHRIYGFATTTAVDSIFTDENGNNVSVAQYFQTKYGISIPRSDWPCVITHAKRKILIPVEVLSVRPEQRLTKAMTPQQTSNMIRVAATKPHIRIQGATNAMNRINHNNDATCQAFGINVDKRPVRIQARVLPNPVIQYNQGSDIPRGGFWDARFNKKMATPAPIFNWCVINMTRANDNEVRGFLNNLKVKADSMGAVMMESRGIWRCRDNEISSTMRRLTREFQKPNNTVRNFTIQLFLIISAAKGDEVYRAIKRVGDVELGIATQVMQIKHLRKPRDNPYYGNLLLKMNGKLGGFNNTATLARNVQAPPVPFEKVPHIVLGADVTHPAAGGTRPSVAALVGSKNPEATVFTGSIRNMPRRQELMTDIGAMFTEVYKRWWGVSPNLRNHASAVVMFRDGVSEGQFQQVLDVELEQIRRACHSLGFNPRITYIVVTKRHHARFFPTNPREADRSGNILPGTVVDTEVVSSEFFDFYLNSHAGIQGTSRPSKYTVLIDENNIPVDALQAYVYKVTHTYARCNRSVSIVPSAYYAHLLAFRGRMYLDDDDSDASSSVSTETIVPPTVALHPILSKRPFFL